MPHFAQHSLHLAVTGDLSFPCTTLQTLPKPKRPHNIFHRHPSSQLLANCFLKNYVRCLILNLHVPTDPELCAAPQQHPLCPYSHQPGGAMGCAERRCYWTGNIQIKAELMILLRETYQGSILLRKTASLPGSIFI